MSFQAKMEVWQTETAAALKRLRLTGESGYGRSACGLCSGSGRFTVHPVSAPDFTRDCRPCKGTGLVANMPPLPPLPSRDEQETA